MERSNRKTLCAGRLCNEINESIYQSTTIYYSKRYHASIIQGYWLIAITKPINQPIKQRLFETLIYHTVQGYRLIGIGGLNQSIDQQINANSSFETLKMKRNTHRPRAPPRRPSAQRSSAQAFRPPVPSTRVLLRPTTKTDMTATTTTMQHQEKIRSRRQHQHQP